MGACDARIVHPWFKALLSAPRAADGVGLEFSNSTMPHRFSGLEPMMGTEPALLAENLPPPVVRSPGTFCHVVAIDLC
jgi:hypothetical protein